MKVALLDGIQHSSMSRVETFCTPVRDPMVPTVFHEAWWLNAVTDGDYEEVTVTSGGKLAGRLPFVKKRSFGLLECEMPELTPVLGPAIDEGEGSPVTRRFRRRTITRELIERLPPFSSFFQRLHADSEDTLPFSDFDFATRVIFSFETPAAPEVTLWSGIRDKTRRVVRRANESHDVVNVDPQHFCEIYERNLLSRGMKYNYMWKRNAIPALSAAIARARGRILGARDYKGDIVSAICYLWDDRSSYFLLSTRALSAHSGSISLLVWEAMRDSAIHGRKFDFGGADARGSVALFTAFGGAVKPLYLVHRRTRAFQALSFARTKYLDGVRRLQARQGVGKGFRPDGFQDHALPTCVD